MPWEKTKTELDRARKTNEAKQNKKRKRGVMCVISNSKFHNTYRQ